MTSTNSIFYDFFNDEDKKELKSERKKALLEQKNHLLEYKKKIASYNAKMAATGAGLFSDAVNNGLTKESEYKNALIASKFNRKLSRSKNKKRRQTLLTFGIKNI